MVDRLSEMECEIIKQYSADFSEGTVDRRPGCPGDLELRAYQFGYMPLTERIRTYFHVRGCVHCYARTTALEADDPRPVVPMNLIRAKVLSKLSEGSVAARSWWKAPSYVGAAATLAVVALSAGIFMRGTSEHSPVYRGTEYLISAQVDRAPGKTVVIRWKSISNAAYYNLDIYRADLEGVVFKTRLTTTKYGLSDEEMGQLEKGKSYYCRIEAMNDLNERLAASRSMSFSVGPGTSGVLATSAE